MDWLKTMLHNPDIRFWPEVRWWLAEGFHTDRTLRKDIQMLHESGFGAAEFIAMPDDGANDDRYGWGSEEWVHDSHVVVEETTRLGMGASFTSGANWETANLTNILPDDRAASKELSYTAETLAPGKTRSGPLSRAAITREDVREQILIAVVAGKRLNRTLFGAVLDKDSLLVLTDRVTGERDLTWTAPEDGAYELITFWMHGTGQTGEPAKGTAYAVNYMDRYGVDALIQYWDKVVLTPELREYVRQNGRVQMFMDSLEIATYGNGGQVWGYSMLEEFRRRRGYDLTPYLPYLMRPCDHRDLIGEQYYTYESQDDIFTEKVRYDLSFVLTELYMENMLQPFREWLHTVGIELRAQVAYGMPYDITLPGKHVDYTETESFEFGSQVDSFRHLAGAAFLYDKLYSSETGAVRLNYMMGLGFYNQIIFTQFAGGVARTILHGYSSIEGPEESTRWPGHEGMWPVFSERFGERQPYWLHRKDWSAALARFQRLLQQGKPKRDLLMLRLDYQLNNRLHRHIGIDEETIYERMYLRANKGIYWQDMSLQNAGYTYDYAAPQLLEDEDISFRDGVIEPDGPAYRAVVVYQEQMPLSSAKRLLAWARQGLPILIVNGVTEMVRNEVYRTHCTAACRTPYLDGEDETLARVMKELKALPNVIERENDGQACEALMSLRVQPRTRFPVPNRQVLTFTRKDERASYVYLYHYMYTENAPFSFRLRVEGEGIPALVNCWANTVTQLGAYTAQDGYTEVDLTLSPGEASVLVIENSANNRLHAVAANAPVIIENGRPVILASRSGRYEVELSDGSRRVMNVEAPPAIPLIRWNLVVEDWNQGEKRCYVEDRGLGYETKEVWYETQKTRIPVGETTLIPWKDLPSVGPAVSGVGYYSVTVQCPDGWDSSHMVAVLRLGNLHQNTAAVYINGEKAHAVDPSHPVVDITTFLREKENTLLVEVSSSLNNRMLQRGYYDTIIEWPDSMAGHHYFDGKLRTIGQRAFVRDYGMTGEPSITFYNKAILI